MQNYNMDAVDSWKFFRRVLPGGELVFWGNATLNWQIGEWSLVRRAHSTRQVKVSLRHWNQSHGTRINERTYL